MEKMVIKPGDVYKFDLSQSFNEISSGVRWGIIVDIDDNNAELVVIANKDSGKRDPTKEYLNLEFDRKGGTSCILTDHLIKVAVTELYGKIGQISPDKLEKIKTKIIDNRKMGVLFEQLGIVQDIVAFFENKRFSIPIKFSTDDFRYEIKRLLSAYIWKLSENGVAQEIIETIESFSRLIDRAVASYLMGIHSEAFNAFEQAVERIFHSVEGLLEDELSDDLLFRGRVNESGCTDYDDGEMYHIPLSKRGIVSTQRFSFPGLPCLYLGASVYTCWTELDRPQIDCFQVAAIKPCVGGKMLKVIDLSKAPSRLSSLIKEPGFTDEAYYLYWPLMALCSIKVRNDKHTFKPEYIFPQFFLEYILKRNTANKYVGVKYVSIKTVEICEQQLKDDWHTYVSFVFPSHSDRMDKEKCELLDQEFKILVNRSGKELGYLVDLLENDEAKPKIESLNDIPSELDIYKGMLSKRGIYTRDAKRVPYSISIFGMIELAMVRDDFDVDIGKIIIGTS